MSLTRKTIDETLRVSFKKRPWTNFLEYLATNFRTYKAAFNYVRRSKPGSGLFLVSMDRTNIVFIDLHSATVTAFLNQVLGTSGGDFEVVMDYYKSGVPWTRERFLKCSAKYGIKYDNLDDYADLLFGEEINTKQKSAA